MDRKQNFINWLRQDIMICLLIALSISAVFVIVYNLILFLPNIIKIISIELKYVFIIFIFWVLFVLIKKARNIVRTILESERGDYLLSIIISPLIAYFLLYPAFELKFRIVFNPTVLQINIEIFGFCIFFSLIKLLFQYFDIQQNSFHRPLFLSDDPYDEENEDDLLNFRNDAESFAIKILNNNSKQSIVFGIDGPWGCGKTTYLKYCLRSIKDIDDKAIIYRFEPLKTKDVSNLFDQFVQGLITTIKSKIFNPTLQGNLNKYLSLVTGFTNKYTGLPARLFEYETIETSYLRLKEFLKKFDHKIIIAIDDLDRLPLEEVKLMVDVVKNSLSLPNLTFILCYSTENINTFNTLLKEYRISGQKENIIQAATNSTEKVEAQISEEYNNDKISDYFEKIVNVKQTLLFKQEKLKDYFLANIEKLYDPELRDETLLNQLNTSINELFVVDFPIYQDYLDSIRKLKILINLVILRDILAKRKGTILKSINYKELIKLLILYTYFPNLFRKIYLFETGNNSGFFTLTRTFDTKSDSLKYVNSLEYKNYIKGLSREERIIIEDLFDERKFYKKLKDNEKYIFESCALNLRENYGVFPLNNLERVYLNTIANIDEEFDPFPENNYHVKMVNRFITQNNFEEADLTKNGYTYQIGEQARVYLFSTIISQIQEINYAFAQALINYFVENITNYSLIDHKILGDGLRNNIIYYIVYILDQKGWKDEDGNFMNNSKENIMTISKQIFGEGEFSGRGIINKLSGDNRGILGINDLLVFRLTCCGNRNGDNNNIYDALGYHEDSNAQTAGDIKTLAIQQMRELSQFCFKIFKEKYINKSLNIFNVVQEIPNDEFLGKYKDFIKKKARLFRVDLHAHEEIIKNNITGFILYQLGSKSTDFGIGCGFYDETGKDNNGGIYEVMQSYLFNTCFNPGMNGNSENLEYFVTYLLSNLSMLTIKRIYLPKKEKFVEVLNKEKLIAYWEKNRTAIKENFKNRKNFVVQTYNYYTNQNDIDLTFKELDELVENKSYSPSESVG